jgi:glucose-6-phosphate 1-dehydrogenase
MTTIAPEAAATAAKILAGRQAPPATMVIFGAGGDLTKRLVVPALYNLVRAGKLPDEFALIGVDHNEETTEQWRQSLTKMMQVFMQASAIDVQAWSWLTSRMQYMPGDFLQPETFGQLAKLLAERRERTNTRNALFYLAVADRFFGPVIEQLGQAGLTQQSEGAWRRVIVEKPFGHDLPSAEALNAQILKVLSEDQIYRIDHFLGKETVQNILVLRFANGIFEPLWNRDHIDHVQITAAETVGVEARGRFYERTGALRDMVPNHLFQLLAMIGMEPPISFNADAVRAKKTELLEAIHRVSPENAVRGQYGSGVVLGQKVPDYRHEPNVAPDSGTETYVALKLGIDNWRWAGCRSICAPARSCRPARPKSRCIFGKPPTRFFATHRSNDCLPISSLSASNRMRDCRSVSAPSDPAPRSKSTVSQWTLRTASISDRSPRWATRR